MITEEAQKTLEESMAMDADDRQESDLVLYRSRQGGSGTINAASGTLGKRSTLARKAMHPPPPTMLGKSPPRPSPASVAYHSDEESLKGYDENPDDSSVTEKPSEISSTDSQVNNYFVDKEIFTYLLINYKSVFFYSGRVLRARTKVCNPTRILS